MIKCCNGVNCPGRIYIDKSGITFTSPKDETEHRFYLDANAICTLIKELKDSLLERADLRYGLE